MSRQRDAGTKSPEDDADSLLGRRLLCHLLKVESTLPFPRIKYSPELPWGQVAIDEELCSGCGICTAVCPTGALVESLEAGCKVLHFNFAVCVNCRLCSEACPQMAVKFEEEFTLVKGLPDETEVVARIRLPTCTLCGDIMWAGKARLCPTCEKRQLATLYNPAPVDSAGAASSKQVF